MSVPPLTLVVACERSWSDAATRGHGEWLTAARRAVTMVRGELLVVGERDAGGEYSSAASWERFLAVDAATTIPERWSVGALVARGEIIALSTDGCTLPTYWAANAIAGVHEGAVAVGGSFALNARASRTDRAVYFLRYGAFIAGGASDDRPRADIAGDNAAYDRGALALIPATWASGFWEVIVNAALRERGGVMRRRTDLIVGFGSGGSFLPMLRQRFAHGQHAGRWRAESGQRPWWLIVLASPLVPLVLLQRSMRRAIRDDWHLPVVLLSIVPEFLTLAAAWAAGEAVGAWRATVVSRPAPHR